MAIKKSDVQLSFDFGQDEPDVEFTTVRGVCRCGRPWEFRISGIVKEMTVPCPGCSAMIVIKADDKA